MARLVRVSAEARRGEDAKQERRVASAPSTPVSDLELAAIESSVADSIHSVWGGEKKTPSKPEAIESAKARAPIPPPPKARWVK